MLFVCYCLVIKNFWEWTTCCIDRFDRVQFSKKTGGKSLSESGASDCPILEVYLEPGQTSTKELFCENS